MVIANIDCGVRWSHRILKNNFLPGHNPVKKPVNLEDENHRGTRSHIWRIRDYGTCLAGLA